MTRATATAALELAYDAAVHLAATQPAAASDWREVAGLVRTAAREWAHEMPAAEPLLPSADALRTLDWALALALAVAHTAGQARTIEDAQRASEHAARRHQRNGGTM